MIRKTIYQALREKLDREPSDTELRREVERIKAAALATLASQGRLKHQRRA